VAKLDLPRQQVSVSTKRLHLCPLGLPAAHEGADSLQPLARCVPRADLLAGCAIFAGLLGFCPFRILAHPRRAWLGGLLGRVGIVLCHLVLHCGGSSRPAVPKALPIGLFERGGFRVRRHRSVGYVLLQPVVSLYVRVRAAGRRASVSCCLHCVYSCRACFLDSGNCHGAIHYCPAFAGAGAMMLRKQSAGRSKR
jgi:hypothetical protein